MPMMYNYQTASTPQQFIVNPKSFESHGVLIEPPSDFALDTIQYFEMLGDFSSILHQASIEKQDIFAVIDGYKIPNGFIGFVAKDTMYKLQRFEHLSFRMNLYAGGEVQPTLHYWHLWRILV